MTGIEAVLATLTGAVVNPIPVDLTAPAWTCPRCQQVVCVPLGDARLGGSTTLDDVLDMADHRCEPGT